MDKVLVTGGNGFVGRALVAKLQRAGHGVVSLSSEDGVVENEATFRRLAGAGFSWAFHLAGRTYVPESWKDPVGFCRVNSLGTANVLEYCRSEGVALTYVSAYLYGQPTSLPIGEDSPIKPNNPYALSKVLAEKICEFYASVHRIPVTVLRPFNVYGAGQDGRFLIPSLVSQVLYSETIPVQDLLPKRDYVFIDDLVEALMLTIGRHSGYAVYNIGSGSSLSVRELIDVIQSVARTSKKIVSAQARRPNEIDDVVANISRAEANLNWRPKHSFEQGVRKILDASPGRQA